MTREMFCLMEGRHVHPSTLYPGGVGTVATIQLMTDYMTRLMRYVEFMKKVVPMHDDLFDFFYEALPGYEQVGLRRTLLGCWGSFQDPELCNFDYKDMTDWGRKMFVTPGVVVDGKLVTTDLVEINLGIRILLGSSYYDDWEDQEMFVTNDPLGNPVDRRHPWNQHTNPKPQKRDLDDKYSWVMSPRWYDGKDSPRPRHRRRPAGPAVVHGAGRPGRHRLRQGDRAQRADQPAEDRAQGPGELEWKIPQWSNTIERNRARTYFQAYAAACALHFAEKALVEIRAGRTKTWEKFEVPDEGIGCGFTEAVRGVLSHHMVIRDGKIANYHPYPPTPWNANPRDSYGTPGPYEDAVQGQPIFEENDREHFKGIDIMRTVRSFDPCLPCGVHMYLGGGKKLELLHSPTQSRHRLSRRHAPDASSTRTSRLEPIDLRLDSVRPASGSTPAERARDRRAGRPAARRGAGRAGDRPLRRRARAAAGDPRRRRPARRRAARRAGRRRPGRQPAAGARPASLRRRRPGSSGRWTACGPTSARTAATSSCSTSTTTGVVTLRMLGSCDGCPSSSVTLQLAVEGAIEAAAPEVTAIEVETARRDRRRG